MNIFFSSINPQTAAENLNHPQLIKKMWIENLQMLCTTFNLRGIESPGKNFNPAHESRMWLDESRENFRWLLNHTVAIIDLATPMLKNPPKFKGQDALDLLDYLDSNLYRLVLPARKMTLPYLAMKKTAPDLVKDFGNPVNLTSPITGNYNEAWRASSWGNAIAAYQEFLTRKPYWQPHYTFS